MILQNQGGNADYIRPFFSQMTEEGTFLVDIYKEEQNESITKD